MKRQKQHVRSMHHKLNRAEQIIGKTNLPKSDKKHHGMYMKVHNTQVFMYTGQTGRFPNISSKENQNMM